MSRLLGWGLFLLTCSIPALAQDYCQWEDAPLYFAREKVRLVLDGNVVIEGAWVGVDARVAKIVVSRSSNRKLYAVGLASIPKSAIREAAYRGHGSVGKVLGFLGGLMLAGAVAFRVPRVAALPAYVGAVAGGIYTGREVDRRWHTVRILP
jgi:hypothetical protein